MRSCEADEDREWGVFFFFLDGVWLTGYWGVVPPVPIFGNGDCYSSQDYWTSVEKSGVDGCMIGRGALIKPWIFTEVKERREWDISARERLEGVRKVGHWFFFIHAWVLTLWW